MERRSTVIVLTNGSTYYRGNKSNFCRDVTRENSTYSKVVDFASHRAQQLSLREKEGTKKVEQVAKKVQRLAKKSKDKGKVKAPESSDKAKVKDDSVAKVKEKAKGGKK